MFVRLIFLAALAAAPAAFAASPINQTRPLAADGQVSIDNVKGRVTVRTWDRSEVRITGSLGAGVEKLAIEGDASDLRIEVRYPKSGGGWFGWGGGDGDSEPTMLEISVPAKASVSVDAVSADVDVAGTGGRRLALASVSGDVLVRSARADEASFESVSGDVDAEVDSTNVSAETVSGDLMLKGRIGGRVSLDTVSGDATLVGTLQAHVKARLAPYEYPKEIEFIDALPMTTTGKVQRRVLRLREQERAAAAALASGRAVA